MQIDTITQYVIWIFPGLVMMQTYRLLLPGYRINWAVVIPEAIFYSLVNFALLFWLILWVQSNLTPENNAITLGIAYLFILLIAPILWPVFYRLLIERWAPMRKLQLPYISSWDYFFSKREAAFLLVHLKSGKQIGGYFGTDSYASSYPDHGDLYLEALVETKDDGTFGKFIGDTAGLLITKD